VRRASGPVFMFCAPGLIFDGSEGVGSSFHLLRSRTHFQRFRGRRVLFSCFALPDLFSAVPTVSGPIFMFCGPRHVFGRAEGVGSYFHVLRSRTRFRRCGGRQVAFSCFASPYSFWAIPKASDPVFMLFAPGLVSAVPRTSAPVFMFCAPEIIFDGTDGVRSRFHFLRSRTRFRRCGGRRGPFYVLRSRTRFRRFRGRRVPFSCFAFPYSFLAIPRASGPLFMLCAPGFIFGSAEGVGFCFHDLRSRTRFRRHRGCRLPFPCFARPNSFSVVPTASGPVIMFSVPDTAVRRASGPVLMYCAP
jgi:hypothetical protein